MYGFVITTAGEAMLARAAAGEKLVLDAVMVGRGVVESAAAAKGLSALIDPVAAATSTAPAVSGNQISVTVEYRNDLNGGLEAGFALSEFGISAHVGDDPAALLYYGSLGDAPQPVKPISEGLNVHRFPVAIAVTGEVSVTMEYPAGGFLTKADLGDLNFDPAGSAKKVQDALDAHTKDKQNPHRVTAEQIKALPITGGTVTGPISLPEDPVQDLEAAPKQYVDKAAKNAAALIRSYPVAEGQSIHAGDVVDVVDGKVVGSTKRVLSTLAEGSIVYLNESSSLVPFLVAKHNYESSLNGAGRTLLLRKDLYDKRVWHSSQVNYYASSAIDSWLNNEYKSILDAEVQAAIGTTKFRCTNGNGNNSVNTFTRSIFLPSFTELGQSASYANVEGSVLPIASTHKIAYLDGAPFRYWTRSPSTSQKELVCEITEDGGGSWTPANSTLGSRPAFTLPDTYQVFTDKRIPSQAIAMQDGEVGDTIEVIYSGVVKAPWATAGNTFRDGAGGVFGFSPIDGVLEVMAKQALEQAFEQGIKIATGIYTGTGTYGADNPNTLTLPFEPKVLIVSAMMDAQTGHTAWIYGDSSGAVNSSYAVILSWDNNTVSWYSPNSASYQLNGNALSYQYVAIG